MCWRTFILPRLSYLPFIEFGTGAKPMTSLYTKVLSAMFGAAIFLGVGIALANAAIPPMTP